MFNLENPVVRDELWDTHKRSYYRNRYAVRFDLVKYFQLVEEKDTDGTKYYSVNAATEDGSFCLESFTTVELAREYLKLLNALGAYYRAENPDITKCVVLSQRCH